MVTNTKVDNMNHEFNFFFFIKKQSEVLCNLKRYATYMCSAD